MEPEEDIKVDDGRVGMMALDLEPEDRARYETIRDRARRRLVRRGPGRPEARMGRASEPVELFWYDGRRMRLRSRI